MATHRCLETHRGVIAEFTHARTQAGARAHTHSRREIKQGKQRIACALFGEFVQLKSKCAGGAKLLLIIIISAEAIVISKYLLSCFGVPGTVSTIQSWRGGEGGVGAGRSLWREISMGSCCKSGGTFKVTPGFYPSQHGDVCSSLLRSHQYEKKERKKDGAVVKVEADKAREVEVKS